MTIRPGALLPVLLFLGFIIAAFFGLMQDKEGRALVKLEGRAVPAFSLPLKEGGMLDATALGKGTHLVNFFASWCAPCAAEHAFLLSAAKESATPFIGIIYKDKPEALEKFFARGGGNPFAKLALDASGRGAIEWGVTGVPETFLIKDGIIIAHAAGPLTEKIWSRDFAPYLK